MENVIIGVRKFSIKLNAKMLINVIIIANPRYALNFFGIGTNIIATTKAISINTPIIVVTLKLNNKSNNENTIFIT